VHGLVVRVSLQGNFIDMGTDNMKLAQIGLGMHELLPELQLSLCNRRLTAELRTNDARLSALHTLDASVWNFLASAKCVQYEM